MGKFQTFESFIHESNYISEKIQRPVNKFFNKKEIEQVLIKHPDIELILNDGSNAFIAPHMHVKGKLEHADNELLYATDINNNDIPVNYKDIKYIKY